MCNLIKRLIRATFLSTPASMNDENKRHVQAMKIASAQEILLTINKRNIIR